MTLDIQIRINSRLPGLVCKSEVKDRGTLENIQHTATCLENCKWMKPPLKTELTEEPGNQGKHRHLGTDTQSWQQQPQWNGQRE